MYREATTCEQGQGRIPSHASSFDHDSRFIVLILSPSLLLPQYTRTHHTHPFTGTRVGTPPRTIDSSNDFDVDKLVQWTRNLDEHELNT